MRQIKPTQPTTLLLQGHCVLLAEDDSAGPRETERQLSDAGARVMLAQTVYQATLVVSQHPLTAAVIDADLGPETIDGISELLRDADVPMLLLAQPDESVRAGYEHMAQVSSANEVILRLFAAAAGQAPAPAGDKPLTRPQHRLRR
jgi:ActR/RegA family two-component response regulator